MAKDKSTKKKIRKNTTSKEIEKRVERMLKTDKKYAEDSDRMEKLQHISLETWLRPFGPRRSIE